MQGTTDLAPGWTATTERAESSHGLPVYVATECDHGKDIAHSLEEAIGCGAAAAEAAMPAIREAIANHSG